MSSLSPLLPSARPPKGLRLAGVTILIIALAVAGVGIFQRWHAQGVLATWTAAQAIPTVHVVTPLQGSGDQEIVLPANVEPYVAAPIFARVSGYLKRWNDDIGANVKAGDVLAEIDTPELDQQWAQAKADLATAQANATLATLTAKRWNALKDSDSVSEQAVDEKSGDATAKQAAVAAAQANLQRLAALESFKKIVAPFDGVVTERKTDIGALIDAGSGKGAELFSLADIHQMRVYLQVPQALAAQLHSGLIAKLKLPQYPDRLFTATLSTTARSVSAQSRTMLVEFTADNPDGALWAGAYAEAHIQLPADPTILHLPTSALMFRQEGPQVAVVGAGNKVELRTVEVGRDLGTDIEIRSGISVQDRVIDNPPDSLAAGDLVQPSLPTTHGAP